MQVKLLIFHITIFKEPKAEIKLNINSQGMLQKTVNVGTLQRPAVGLVKDNNTGKWHEEAIMDKEKVMVQSTKLVNTENTHFVNIDLESGKYIPDPKFQAKMTFGSIPINKGNFIQFILILETNPPHLQLTPKRPPKHFRL